MASSAPAQRKRLVMTNELHGGGIPVVLGRENNHHIEIFENGTVILEIRWRVRIIDRNDANVRGTETEIRELYAGRNFKLKMHNENCGTVQYSAIELQGSWRLFQRGIQISAGTFGADDHESLSEVPILMVGKFLVELAPSGGMTTHSRSGDYPGKVQAPRCLRVLKTEQ